MFIQTRKELHWPPLQRVDEVLIYFHIINQKHSRIVGFERRCQFYCSVYVLKDALLYALVHRDYTYLGPTIINPYTNKIEFIPLGGIIYCLNLEDISSGIIEARNPKLVKLFYKLNMIDADGTRLKRIIDSDSNIFTKPGIISTDNTFTIVFTILIFIIPCHMMREIN